MHRHIRALFLGLLCIDIVAPPLRSAATPPPNILLIFADNLGYGDLGCYGNTTVKTPNIDRLAAEGVRCTDFYIASPTCAPSRGAILSGRHPERTGFNYQAITYPRLPSRKAQGDGLPRTEKIIPYYLKPLGYATGAFGKWNIGFMPGSRPTERGFDEFLGQEGGNMHYYTHRYHGQSDLRRGTEPVDLTGQYATDLFAETAIDFIRKNRDRPWFVYLPFNAVHGILENNVVPGEKVEWQVPAKYLAQYGLAPDEPDSKKRFRAVLTALDDAVGRVLATVDELGQRQRTVVLFISDNGAFPNMLAGTGSGDQSNAPFRSGSGTTYEGGLRVPAVFRWPGHFKPRTTCREMLSTLDVLPMIVSAAGGKLPDDRVIDGRNPIPALAGEAPSPHKTLHWAYDPSANQQWRAMREDNFKIVRANAKTAWELYDLTKDPGESKDLAKARPEVTAALAQKFEQWHSVVTVSGQRGQ